LHIFLKYCGIFVIVGYAWLMVEFLMVLLPYSWGSWITSTDIPLQISGNQWLVNTANMS